MLKVFLSFKTTLLLNWLLLYDTKLSYRNKMKTHFHTNYFIKRNILEFFIKLTTIDLSFLKLLRDQPRYIINGGWFRRRFKNERSTVWRALFKYGRSRDSHGNCHCHGHGHGHDHSHDCHGHGCHVTDNFKRFTVNVLE